MNNEKQKELHAKIKNYLIENKIERGPGCYVPIANKFGVTSEYVRDIYRKLRKSGKVENERIENFKKIANAVERRFTETPDKKSANVTVNTDIRVQTLEQLIDICNIDLNIWKVDTWECNKWEVGRKAKEYELEWTNGVMNGKGKDKGVVFVEPLFQVKAKLKRRELDSDLVLQKELILEEIANYERPTLDSSFEFFQFNTMKPEDAYALEINIPDLHIGKLAWADETGEHYDLKIAVQRYKDSVSELIRRTPALSIDRYILVIGNDMLNVDGKHNMTTNGTPQSSDGRFYKMMQVAQNLMIETIDRLSHFAPVDVIVVPGNHDNNSMLSLGDVLSAWYRQDKRIEVFNSPKQRKYYQYGLNGFMYTHGNEEKHSELGMIFAAENPQLWADTKYRVCKIGHYHKNKKMQYVSVDEFQGFQVQILPSLSGSDAWHASKGYNSLKQAKAFLYSKDKGLLAEYTHNI